MADRLQWIRLQPRRWADWEPVRGGWEVHDEVARRYPDADALVVERTPARLAHARQQLVTPWWKRWGPERVQVVDQLDDASVQMVWANMALHLSPDPQGLIGQWHRALAVDGFLMFSCFGPDTLRELRELYGELGWPPPGPAFTDMHDWGDMLVHAGFAEPVMDMERVTLTWTDAKAMLAELRELGSNVHPGRFDALRGRRWHEQLLLGADRKLGGADGRLALSFEIIYGHALRPAPRARVAGETSLSLDDMRSLLRQGGGAA